MMRRLLLLLGAGLMLGAAAPAPSPRLLPPAEAAREGKALVADILSRKPAQNITNSGRLKIRNPQGQWTEFTVTSEIAVADCSWSSVYHAKAATNSVALAVIHTDGGGNEYRLTENDPETTAFKTPAGNATMIPFAGSDFWVADLGLEFFRWPEQRLLKTELRRSRSCRVLESVNPQPAPGAYSRVVSWIDLDSDGIVHAEAYDFKNKLLKEFDPRKLKKIDGQWQLQEMRIENAQTGSRTWIEFDLGSE